jgi:hypothetical protein
MNRHTFVKSIAIAAFAAASGAAVADKLSWEYKSYQKDPVSGQYTKERFLTSTITLEEKDGKATFRMLTVGKGDPCISRSDLPAEVQRDAETMTITVTPTMAGCEPFRYIIRNDGSGGVRQHRRNERWSSDGFDHGLTPKK